MIINKVKFVIQRMLRSGGYEIRRFENSDISELVVQLQSRNIKEILDIGANEGQFASAVIDAGYEGLVISCEPLSLPHKNLSNLAKKFQNWIAAPRAAVGADFGVLEINVSRNSVSSSILPILEPHLSSAPDSKYIGRESVSVTTVDKIIEDYKLSSPFLKIDTQGYEMRVLQGASKSLKNISGVMVEISLVDLYAGQPDYIELISFIRGSGFDLWSIRPGFRDLVSGRLLQFDAIFFKK